MPHPVNITAYTQPHLYNDYINHKLVPATANAAHSSLTTIVDQEAVFHLCHENVDQFHRLIDKEMMDRKADVPITWIDRFLFPDAIFPPSFNDMFWDSEIMWEKDRVENWKYLPSELKEPELEHWLNLVVHSFGILFDKFKAKKPHHAKDKQCDRQWDKRTANLSPIGGSQNRKPDLSLLSRQMCSYLNDPCARPGWQGILAFIEVTMQVNTFDKVVRNMVEKAYLVFEGQPFWHFVVALGFFGPVDDPMWALVMVDRSGIVLTSQFSIAGMDGIVLARVLYILSFRKPADIGVDNTMTINLYTGVVTHITVCSVTPTSPEGKAVRRQFEAIRILHAVSQIMGHATRVWLVCCRGIYYILKDSWPVLLEPFSEIKTLLTINKTIKNDETAQEDLRNIYPCLIVTQDLSDSTVRCHASISYSKNDPGTRPSARVHRHVVTKPIGDPLTSFWSKYELCSVLCDIVKFLKYISEQCGICHSDISMSNLGIYRDWDDDNRNSIDFTEKDVDDPDFDALAKPSNSDSDSDSDSDDDGNGNDDGKGKGKGVGKGKGIDNSESNANNNNLDLEAWENASVAAYIDERGPLTTLTVGSSNISESDLTSLSTSMATIQPRDIGPPLTTTLSIICGYGLVIDFDNSFFITDAQKHKYKITSGTVPYMAIESLAAVKRSDFTHQPKHDLESLFYVILALCSYTTGPCQLRNHLPDVDDPSICINEWWSLVHDRHQLARNKAGLLSGLDVNVTSHFAAYWDDFLPVIRSLRMALWHENTFIQSQVNKATHDAFLEVLIRARDMYSQMPEASAPLAFASLITNTDIKFTCQKSNIGNDSILPSVTVSSSHKRKDIETDDDGSAVRGQKSACMKGKTRFNVPLHNIDPQPFPKYVDSGLPSVTI